MDKHLLLNAKVTLAWMCVCASFVLSSCHQISDTPAPGTGPPIGVAELNSKGQLEIMLRAEGEGGMVGDAFFLYLKGSPDYKMYMKHVGGLKKGQSKPILPFDTSSKQKLD